MTIKLLGTHLPQAVIDEICDIEERIHAWELEAYLTEQRTKHMHDYSIVAADKVINFATKDEAVRAFVDGTNMLDQHLNPGNTHLAYYNNVVLGEEIIAYAPGTVYEMRLHGVSHAEWNAMTDSLVTPTH